MIRRGAGVLTPAMATVLMVTIMKKGLREIDWTEKVRDEVLFAED